MTQFKTFSDFERAALKAHGLDTKRPSQLSDAFVLGMRYAATVAEGLDCAHGYEPASGVPEGGKCQAPEVCGEAKECRYRCYAHPSGVGASTEGQPK